MTYMPKKRLNVANKKRIVNVNHIAYAHELNMNSHSFSSQKKRKERNERMEENKSYCQLHSELATFAWAFKCITFDIHNVWQQYWSACRFPHVPSILGINVIVTWRCGQRGGRRVSGAHKERGTRTRAQTQTCM
jgi:hypothetical protein